MKWWPVGLAGFPIKRWWLATSPVSQAGDGKALAGWVPFNPTGIRDHEEVRPVLWRGKLEIKQAFSSPSDL